MQKHTVHGGRVFAHGHHPICATLGQLYYPDNLYRSTAVTSRQLQRSINSRLPQILYWSPSHPSTLQFLAFKLHGAANTAFVMIRDELGKELDTIADVMGMTQSEWLISFTEMWYHIVLWALFSSIFVHTCAALIAFVTLRKHKFGRFFSILILVMGVVSPATSGVISSAAIAFVYRASSLEMSPIYAMLWGIGQTVLSACIGFTRILATL